MRKIYSLPAMMNMLPLPDMLNAAGCHYVKSTTTANERNASWDELKYKS